MTNDHNRAKDGPWAHRVNAGGATTHGPIYVTGHETLSQHYEALGVGLIEQSGLQEIIGDRATYARMSPLEYHSLVVTSREIAMHVVGEAMGLVPPEASSHVFGKMLSLLDGHMAADPQYKEMPEAERQEIACRAAGNFKEFCRKEISNGNGMLAMALKKGLTELRAPSGAETAR